jgi:hypothetical protein
VPDGGAVLAALDQIKGQLVRLRRVGTVSATAPPEPSSGFVGQRLGDQFMFAGPELFVLANVDGSTCSVASRGTLWEVARDDTGTRLIISTDAEARDYTITPTGELVDNLAELWRATHVVGARPLEVGGVPTGTFTPGTMLDPGLEVWVVETTADGWALVECANTWRCYVALGGLVPLGGGHG